ncbi:MAG: S41 family peptidase [Bacilli bacterium]
MDKNQNTKKKKKELKKEEKAKQIKIKKEPKPIRSNVFRTSEVVFLVVITCIISLGLGIIVANNLGTSKNNSDIFSDDTNLNELIKNYNYIKDNYYDELDETSLLNGAINGMLNTLGDEYSTIIDETSVDMFNIYLEGEYKGLGIVITSDSSNNIIISSVMDDSPASKVGLQIGDIITKVDGIDMTTKTHSDLSEYILNSENTTFTLNIIRNEEEKVYTINKEKVTLKSVSYKTIEKDSKKIGYIFISTFSNTTYEQFKAAIDDLESQNIDGIIMDVRENTGGHLTAVVNMLSLLLDSSNIIYQTETQDVVKKYYSKGTITKEYPIVVLQNNNSASASEMFSVCLQEQFGAIIIGTSSYGKGTVQELIQLENGIEYKVTTKKWLSPKGIWINKIGVTPNIEIELSEDYQNNPIEENDNQLQTAINEFLK